MIGVKKRQFILVHNLKGDLQLRFLLKSKSRFLVKVINLNWLNFCLQYVTVSLPGIVDRFTLIQVTKSQGYFNKADTSVLTAELEGLNDQQLHPI